jgi:hypothetical protein
LQSPEQFVLLVNAVILGCAYFIVYPRFAGADQTRLAINGLNYWGTGERFDLLVMEVGWFGFTVATFLLMELPLFAWYARRYGVFRRNDDE